jgi:hypothetical protein
MLDCNALTSRAAQFFMRLCGSQQKKRDVPNDQLGSKTIAGIRIKITDTGRQVLAEL